MRIGAKTAALLIALVFILVLVVSTDLSGGYFGQVDTAETMYNQHGQKVEYRKVWLDAGDKLAFDLQHNSDRRDEIITRLEKIRTEFEPMKTELSDDEWSDLFRIEDALRTAEVQQEQIAEAENH